MLKAQTAVEEHKPSSLEAQYETAYNFNRNNGFSNPFENNLEKIATPEKQKHTQLEQFLQKQIQLLSNDKENVGQELFDTIN